MELNLERRESSSASCPYCREEVTPAERVSCACGVEYHEECRAELAGCVTVGCQASAPARRASTPRGCCRCGEPVRTRPEPCESCGERHHAWCRTRGCTAGRHVASPARTTGPAPVGHAPPTSQALTWVLGVLGAAPAVVIGILVDSRYMKVGVVLGLALGVGLVVLVSAALMTRGARPPGPS